MSAPIDWAKGAIHIQARESTNQAEKRSWILSMLITPEPLSGLLGIVLGVMQPFHFLGNRLLVAQPISRETAEAWITTASGLLPAIACLLRYN